MPAKGAALKSELARLAAMRDDEIDYSDVPDRGDDDAAWVGAVHLPEHRAPKASLTIRLDAHVVGWFRQQGRGYQTRINEVLRTYVAAQRAHEGAARARQQRAGAPKPAVATRQRRAPAAGRRTRDKALRPAG